MPKNQFSFFFFWNYWKLNKNEMDVYVNGWSTLMSVHTSSIQPSEPFFDWKCNSLMRFLISKSKRIIKIEFLKYKFKIQFSIFKFLNWSLENISIFKNYPNYKVIFRQTRLESPLGFSKKVFLYHLKKPNFTYMDGCIIHMMKTNSLYNETLSLNCLFTERKSKIFI